MVIMVVELPRDQVPFVGISDDESRARLIDAVATAFAMNSVNDEEQGAKENPALTQLAQQFAQGKHAVYIAMHAEPSLEVQMPEQSRSLFNFGKRKDKIR